MTEPEKVAARFVSAFDRGSQRTKVSFFEVFPLTARTQVPILGMDWGSRQNYFSQRSRLRLSSDWE